LLGAVVCFTLIDIAPKNHRLEDGALDMSSDAGGLPQAIDMLFRRAASRFAI